MRRLLPFAIMGLFLSTSAREAQAQANIDGTWEISWETQRGATTSTFTFVQDGDAFTGTAEMMMRGRPGGGGGEAGEVREIEITDGKVDGDLISFSMAMGMGERSMSFTFTGTVTGDAMEGTMVTPRGETPFKGVRK